MIEDHPHSEFFPLLPEDELAELAQDIRENGLKQPILLYENKILDGRNRYRACLSVDIDPRFEQYNGRTPIADVISWNTKRRHLTKTQIATVLLDALPLLEKEKERVRLSNLKQNTEGELTSPLVPRGKSTDILGAQAGVSGRLIRQVKAIKEHSPERFEQVRTGKMQLKEARRLTQQDIQEKEYNAKVQNAIRNHPDEVSKQRIVGFLNDLPIFEGGPFIRPGWQVWGWDCVPKCFKPHIKWTPEEQAAALANYVPPPYKPPTPPTPKEIEADNRRRVEHGFLEYVDLTFHELGIPHETTRRWILEYLRQ